MAQEMDGGAGASTLLTPGKAAVTLLLMVPIFGVYIAGTLALGLSASYAGFVFLTYWAGFRGAENAEFVPGLVGSLGALVICWLLQIGPERLGPAGFAPAMALILLSIFCLLCGWLPVLFNMGLMLMLTVASIPPLAATHPLPDMALCTVLGAAWFGGLKLTAESFGRRRAAAAQ